MQAVNVAGASVATRMHHPLFVGAITSVRQQAALTPSSQKDNQVAVVMLSLQNLIRVVFLALWC